MMPKWTPYDKTRGPMSKLIRTQEEQGGYLAAMTRPWAILICDAHNADIDAITAERDELQRRLREVVASLKPGEKPNCMASKYNPSKMLPFTEYNLDCMWHGMKKQMHTRACAIAEGRTE